MTKILYFLPIMVLSLLASCDAGGGKNHLLVDGDTIALKYTTNLTMVDCGDYIKADFRNPWDTARTLQTFILVPRDAELPDNLPKGTVVRTPLQNTIVYTSVHTSLIDNLQAVDAIKGVCDTKYINTPSVVDRVKQGIIADCGPSMTPNIEKIMMLKPDAILLSAFENSNDHNKVAQTGIPIIDCTDYMESSPLARAEWMRFYGRLFGKGEAADSLFNEVERAYLAIKSRMADVKERPLVLTELIYGQAWSVPAANSTVGVLMRDAGGENPFAEYKKSGSVQLAPEEVLFKAKDADVWLIKYHQPQAPSLRQLAADNALYTKIKAFADGAVYGCNTNNTMYFDDAAFRPDRVLAEYATIFHPEVLGDSCQLNYYQKLEP